MTNIELFINSLLYTGDFWQLSWMYRWLMTCWLQQKLVSNWLCK